jgi:signal peptidase II
LILGGAVGNLIDRILIYVPNSTYNGVIDFIDVGVSGHRWYIFNIADSAVTMGIIIYLFYSTFIENKQIASDA